MKNYQSKDYPGILKSSIPIFLTICFLTSYSLFAQNSGRNPDPETQIAGEWCFSGHLGQYIDKLSSERILNHVNWDKIYPETEEAFRLREDDKNFPQSGQWRGEFWGKYILSAIAASHYFHSDELIKRIEKAVKGLLATQDDNGYIGTYAHSDFVIGNNWNVWCRKYTLWGLIEAWELLQDETILTALKRFADHLISEVGPGAVDIVRTGNFYGLPSSSILQPVVKLYKATGEKKYLEYAEYIVEQWTKHPEGIPDILNKGLNGEPVQLWFPSNDPYKWAKGYEFTSCVEGLAELYEVTQKQPYFEAARNIHSALVKWERTPVGSVSFNDKYVGSAGLINTLSEICDAVYWNRLSFKLFQLTGEEKYIAEIERTLYNTLLSSYNPEGTWGLRRLRMSHIHIPAPNHFLNHHQCCVDNLPRGLFQAAEVVLTNRNNKIYLALFNEGKGRITLPSGQMAGIEIYGDFMAKSNARIIISLDKSEKFNLLLRLPLWSRQTTIKINGTNHKGRVSDNWLTINRNWKNGDQIEINFVIDLRWEMFDLSKFNSKYNDLAFYEKEWTHFRFAGGSNEENNRKYENVQSLSPGDALPHQAAVTFFYGPLALARDVRITEGDIFAPVVLPQKEDLVIIQPTKSPGGIWKAFKLNLGQGQIIKFCDFSSAGNTWSNNSGFNTWCILKTD